MLPWPSAVSVLWVKIALAHAKLSGMKYRNVHISSVAALVMSLVGAAFFAVGRVIFGVGGWLALFSIPAGGIMAVALLGLWFIPVRIVKEDAGSGTYKALGWPESWAFIVVTVFLFLAGFFMVDGGDTVESGKSAFSQIVGRWALDLSVILFWPCVLGVIVSYIVGVVVAVKGRKAAAEDPTQSSNPENRGQDGA